MFLIKDNEKQERILTLTKILIFVQITFQMELLLQYYKDNNGFYGSREILQITLKTFRISKDPP